MQRITVGALGAVELTIGASGNPYYGLMDGFRLMGVFMSEDFERTMPGNLEVLFPKIPLRIAFYDGGLDPDLHSDDQIIRIRDLSSPEDPAIRLTIGMFGTISADYEQPGTGGPDASGTTPDGKKRSSSDGAAGEGK